MNELGNPLAWLARAASWLSHANPGLAPTPLLAPPELMALTRGISWALVLAALAFTLWAALARLAPSRARQGLYAGSRVGLMVGARGARRRPSAWQIAAALLFGGSVLLPGTASPAYWLALAWGAPSLASVGLCALWCLAALGKRAPEQGYTPTRRRWSISLWLWALLGLALGWLLLLDTLALLPPIAGQTLYAWGYGSPALCIAAGAAAVVTGLGLLARARNSHAWPSHHHGGNGRAPESGRAAAVSLTVWLTLALFAATRLPTGNLWDALLDPWLWAALHIATLRQVGQQVWGR